MLLLTHGRTAGISGLFGGLFLPGASDRAGRAWFVGGLVVAGLASSIVAPERFATAGTTLVTVLIAGVLVGYGTRMSGGCTSGHGVCGLSRFSIRSLVATL